LTTDVRPVDTGLSESAERISGLSFEDRCDVIDMIARPYWISLFAQKAP